MQPVNVIPASLQLNPKKLLNSKWTAVKPSNKEKHFIVTKIIINESPSKPAEQIEIEAIHSKRSQIIAWRALLDINSWKQGWV